ncbi:hypothetical protein L7F22_049632 [Adiantum nelumboides]|nr:hypothetical protein [Adiantum nelumboides]
MPIKGFIREFQDMKDGLGSISRRSFDAKGFHFQRTWSYTGVHHERVHKGERVDAVFSPPQEQSCWATMPPELLRDIIQRVEEREISWPSRKDVVACAAVCKAWREITKDLVKVPEISGKLTFPISVKQPGPRDTTMQCFIKRDRISSTYYLYLSLTSTLVDNGKFVLAARKFRRATSSDYIISLDAEDMSRGGETYVGKLRSNFLGTKFTIYESNPCHSGAVASISRPSKRVGPKQNHLPQVPAGTCDVAHISYELNMLGTRGPRRMQCILHSIPVSAIVDGGVAAIATESLSSNDQAVRSVSHLKSQVTVPSVGNASNPQAEMTNEERGKDTPLTLKNKSPRWHEQLQCWCLNFKGRVTVASVKNFQLVAAIEPSSESTQSDQEKVLLQFGKIGKDTFTMDYRYPLSAFQAFAICLSSFDTKLARE